MTPCPICDEEIGPDDVVAYTDDGMAAHNYCLADDWREVGGEDE